MLKKKKGEKNNHETKPNLLTWKIWSEKLWKLTQSDINDQPLNSGGSLSVFKCFKWLYQIELWKPKLTGKP